LVPKFKKFVKSIVDGGYENNTMLIPLEKLDNVTTITRLLESNEVATMSCIRLKKINFWRQCQCMQ